MASYAFEAITAAQALGIQPSDRLDVASATATSVTVVYGPASITLLASGRSVDFAPALADLSIAGNLLFSDGSHLYVGNGSANAFDFGAGNATNDAMFGGLGNDTLGAGGGDNLLQGNQGADRLSAGTGRDTIYGGQDNDSIDVGGGDNFAQGNKGDDRLTGGSGTDTLLGGQGSDTIDGGGGLDFLNGNLGDDHLSGAGQLFGEGGDDRLDLNATSTSSTLDGGAGNDYLSTYGSGFVRLLGGDGDDTVMALTQGGQIVLGGAGNDSLHLGLLGSKSVDGGDGDDWIEVNEGWGQAFGGAGDDTVMMVFTIDASTVSGGDGNDVLSGGGFVTVDGGAGNDTLLGDALIGGSGADGFFMAWGTDTDVLDWSASDKVLLPEHIDRSHILYSEATAATFGAACTLFQQSGYGDHVLVIQVGADVIVFAADNTDPDPDMIMIDAVYLVGRTLADIDASKLA